ncbi:MAG: GNAT family N-acetyltransferase [Acidobacteria bacterium]|nr:GNAT family N-acetyltransferase [Acidobacteriota bacterium]
MALLRAFTAADLGDLMTLSTTVGWNQLEEDWLRLLELEPAGCFGVEEDGRIVTSATAFTYGRELGWIGMVLTLPDYRGRGFARQMMEATLAYCDGRGVQCVKLDATDLGRPVYEKFGFIEEYVVERWKGTLPVAEKRHFTRDWALDRIAFGTDRRALLERTGFSRGGRLASYVGPVVCRTAEEAREQILYSGAAGTVFWDLPLVNEHAVELARELGFAPVRRLWRMRRGAPIAEKPEFVFALAGFEYG